MVNFFTSHSIISNLPFGDPLTVPNFLPFFTVLLVSVVVIYLLEVSSDIPGEGVGGKSENPCMPDGNF